MPPEYPHTGCVKCRDPDTLRTIAHNVIYPVAHLARRLICKRDRQYIPRIHTHTFYQIGNALCEHACLAAACACKKQHRTVRRKNTLSLLFIQCIIKSHLRNPFPLNQFIFPIIPLKPRRCNAFLQSPVLVFPHMILITIYQ